MEEGCVWLFLPSRLRGWSVCRLVGRCRGAGGRRWGFGLVGGSISDRVLASGSVTNGKGVVGGGLRLFVLAFATAWAAGVLLAAAL